MLATAPYFNNGDFSDLTITFSGREIKCHKIILCTSEYLRMLCGPSSSFKEGTAATIELKEDDPDALESILRHIYGDDRISPSKLGDWQYQLELAKASCKYLFPKLEEMAMWRLKQLVEPLTDTSAIIEAITGIRSRGDQEKHFGIASALEVKHLHALLKHDGFRAHLQEYPGVMLSHLDRFTAE